MDVIQLFIVADFFVLSWTTSWAVIGGVENHAFQSQQPGQPCLFLRLALTIIAVSHKLIINPTIDSGKTFHNMAIFPSTIVLLKLNYWLMAK